MKGYIHSYESMSTVDGPGIRYVVFMQGCNLRCKFCHNPDTWVKNTGYIIEAEELVAKILRGENYYKKSGGGVTFSGGEPLLQYDFLIEVCKMLKAHNIHITIDTAGDFDKEDDKINELLKYVDLILFDIKHIDDEMHKWLVGVSNDKILEFASYLSNDLHMPLWIRIVYIPGITDDKDYLDRYKMFINTLKSVEKIEILPYHEMGKYKWEKLGMKYQLIDIPKASEQRCSEITQFLLKK